MPLNTNQFLSDMVDMGEMPKDSDVTMSEETPKEERKPSYPDLYGFNINSLPVIQNAKVGEDLILVSKVRIKSLEMRETDKNGKKATACLEVREAAAYPMSQPQGKEQNKTVEDSGLPSKDDSDFMGKVIGKDSGEE